MSFSQSPDDSIESYMIFGGINEDQYTGKMYEFPLIDNDHFQRKTNGWYIKTTGLYFGD